MFNNFQDPKIFRNNLITQILEIYKMNTVEFNQVFMTLIETIMNIMANQIREVSLTLLTPVYFFIF